MKLECKSGGQTHDLRFSKQAALTDAPALTTAPFWLRYVGKKVGHLKLVAIQLINVYAMFTLCFDQASYGWIHISQFHWEKVAEP